MLTIYVSDEGNIFVQLGENLAWTPADRDEEGAVRSDVS
jgi:hypothetical protein